MEILFPTIFGEESVRKKEVGDAADFPVIEWSIDDLSRLFPLARGVVRSILDLASQRPGELISLREAEETAGRTTPQARGDLAGLTIMTKGRFGRRNWPFTFEWAAGGEEQAYYRMDEGTASLWQQVSKSHGLSRHDDG